MDAHPKLTPGTKVRYQSYQSNGRRRVPCTVNRARVLRMEGPGHVVLRIGWGSVIIPVEDIVEVLDDNAVVPVPRKGGDMHG